MNKTIVIGIAGGSASGKSSISKAVSETFVEHHKVTIINQDDYYKDQSHLKMEERVKSNYDHPDAFDTELLIKHLKDLKLGISINKPVYDFVEHNRSLETVVIEKVDVLILEGIFVLALEDVRKLLDIKIFVDTDSDIRFIRRLVRDLNERGRSLESVVNQYLDTVRPMHEQFIEPSKRYADVIIPTGGSNKVAIDLLITKIASIIA